MHVYFIVGVHFSCHNLCMFREYNNNPKGHYVGDCVVRAISKVMSRPWEKVYVELAIQGFMMCDMPSSNHVWGAYLMSEGYKRNIVPNTCPDCYTVADFVKDHETGKYVLATGSHVVAVCDGDYFDTWDSGDEIPIYYWEEVEDAE